MVVELKDISNFLIIPDEDDTGTWLRASQQDSEQGPKSRRALLLPLPEPLLASLLCFSVHPQNVSLWCTVFSISKRPISESYTPE